MQQNQIFHNNSMQVTKFALTRDITHAKINKQRQVLAQVKIAA